MPYEIMLGLGAMLLASLVADYVGKRSRLPRVTLLVLIGVAAGPYGFDWIPGSVNAASELITTFALTLVAFLLGSELSWDKLRRQGRRVLVTSATVVVATMAAVSGGLYLLGAPLAMALLLGAIATATDPAATQDVVTEEGAQGSFKNLVLGVVAIDDAWGLIVFGFTLAIAAAIVGTGGEASMSTIVQHLGGAVLIGVLTGVPMAFFSGRLRAGRPNQLEAIGFVLVCGGLAIAIHASYLLAATVAGTIVANFARHHAFTFRQIEHFEWPFVTIFFILAGAMLDLSMALASGVLGLGYLGFRVAGRQVGGWIGGRMTGMTASESRWLGLTLLPQAGVAVGLALAAAVAFPDYGEMILAITIGGTVIFEIVGPILTRVGLHRAGAVVTAPNTAAGQRAEDVAGS